MVCVNAIGSLNARGNSNSFSQYNLVDYNVDNGVWYYYRIRQVDIDEPNVCRIYAGHGSKAALIN